MAITTQLIGALMKGKNFSLLTLSSTNGKSGSAYCSVNGKFLYVYIVAATNGAIFQLPSTVVPLVVPSYNQLMDLSGTSYPNVLAKVAKDGTITIERASTSNLVFGSFMVALSDAPANHL